jgi:hypothetical protein
MTGKEISALTAAAIAAAREKRRAMSLDNARKEFRRILKLTEDEQMLANISMDIKRACLIGLAALEEAETS